MQLGITAFIKGLLGFGSSSSRTFNAEEEDHTYIRGRIEDRGPCPGLNSLANHGYLYIFQILPNVLFI